MKAVILAGGEGTRLRPLTCNIPKPMVPILNRPFLEHMLGHLNGYGIDSTILTVCYLPDIIEAHFGDGERTGMELSYVLEGTPLGTAGAIKNVENDLDGTFFVLNGDIFTDLDLGDMVRFHQEKGAKVTLFLTPVEDPSAFGVVETDSTGRVQRFLEKPAPGVTTSHWINGGIYLMEPEVLAHAPAGEFYMFERGLFPKLLEMGVPVYGYQASPYWIDLGTPASYSRVHHDLLEVGLSGNWAEVSSASHEHSSIDPSAKILGPVLLGADCYIGPGSLVQGPSVLGAGCKVGSNSTIIESILWQNVVVEGGAILEKCIVGSGAYIGEVAKVGERCILGDNVVLGKGNHMDRGMVMWPGMSLEPEAVSFH
jgi:mannose-1-phosphate guanylyltransferase